MMSAHTSSLAAWPWIRLATQLGLSLDDILASCGLAEPELRDAAARIPQAKANRLVEFVCNEHGPGAAIAAALTVEAGHFQLVEQAVRAAPTVAEGVDMAVQLFALIHVGGHMEHSRTATGSIVRFVQHPGSHTHPALVELLFAVGLEALRRETGHDVLPTRVTFTHVSMGEHALYEQVFGPAVHFGMRTSSFALPASVTALPLMRANPAALVRARETASQTLSQLRLQDPPDVERARA